MHFLGRKIYLSILKKKLKEDIYEYLKTIYERQKIMS